MRKGLRHSVFAIASLVLAGCATAPSVLSQPPETAKISATRQRLIDLPQPMMPVPVAVYGFTDQTGQFKPVENIQTLSRALTQGATSVLVQSLRDAGHGKWFTVLERERVDNLLKERQIIADTRARYLGETRINPDALPAMLFAGVLLEGGIIGYDSDTETGGFGARYLGVGGNVSYRHDTLTIYLRAVAVKTGEILSSVVSRKSIVSVGIQGDAFRYVSYKDLLEVETGITVNEPSMVALEQAIDQAAHDLVLDGANSGIWAFANKAEAQPLIDKYLVDKGVAPTTAVAAAPAQTAPVANSDIQPPAADKPPAPQSAVKPAAAPAVGQERPSAPPYVRPVSMDSRPPEEKAPGSRPVATSDARDKGPSQPPANGQASPSPGG